MIRDMIRLFMGLLWGRLVERCWSEPVRAREDGRFESSTGEVAQESSVDEVAREKSHICSVEKA
jgi:hypothetical protein